MTPARSMYTALVAEDNAALARVIAFALRKAGFEVRTARDGAEAWEAAQLETFDLVVTDLQMPEMNGLELSSRLHACDRFAETPIVLLTAKGMELEVESLRESHGVDEMLMKPFSPTQLAQLAQQLTQQCAS